LSKTNYIPLNSGDTVAYSQKVGSKTLVKSLAALYRDDGCYQDEVAERPGTCYLFVRHPIARLVSCYRFFKENGLLRKAGLTQTASYEEFVDEILDGGREDIHWEPQIDYHTTPEGTFVPDVTFRFENIAQIWPYLFDVPLLRYHATEYDPKIDRDYRDLELRTYYAADLELWRISRTSWRN
jgi:hypothetical protein